MRDRKAEQEIMDHPVYGPLFYKIREAFKAHLKDKDAYLPEFLLTDDVRFVLGQIENYAGGLGEALLDLFAYAAVKAVKDDSRLTANDPQ